MISSLDLQWIAGFLEGEGCWPRGHQLAMGAAQVQLWPLEKLRRLVGGTISPKRVTNPNAQQSYNWALHGPPAAALTMTLYGLMSPKRKAAMSAALALWKTKAFRSRDRKHCPRGHAYDKIEQGNRHCSVCDRARRRMLWFKRKPVRDAWLERRVAASDHRPCLCGCGALVPTHGTKKRPRRGFLHNHDKRKRDKYPDVPQLEAVRLATLANGTSDA